MSITNIRPVYYWLLIGLILTGIGVNAYFKSQAAGLVVANADNKSADVSNEQLYTGLKPVSGKKMQQLFPDAAGKPMLLMFHSKFCHDCKRMKPVIESALPKHPELVFKSFDILEDKVKQQAVFSAFKPVTVPILVFVSPKGQIENVLYNYQKPATVESGIKAIEQ